MRDKLHWLCVQQRIKYYAYLYIRCFYQRSPSYSKELIVPASQDATSRRLRSADTQSCIRPRTAKLIGYRGFSVAGPSAWNNLPVQIKQTRSLIFSNLYIKQNCSRSRTIIRSTI